MNGAFENSLAKGFFTVQEAARLIRVGNARRIHGWLRGYNDRGVGPLLTRDYEPIDEHEELSFLDLMEVRFVEHFRVHNVKVRSLRLAAEQLRKEFNTAHPFALKDVILVADQADIYIREVFKTSANKADDARLRSLLTNNYVIYEAIKAGLLPGVEFDPVTHLTSRWAPMPAQFPDIIVDPRVAYGRPASPSGVPTETLFDAWVAERQDEAAVAHWYDVSREDIVQAVRFEQALRERPQRRAA